MKTTLFAAAIAATLSIASGSSHAQTCEPVTQSCSEMTQRCIQRCNGAMVRARNPDACVAEHCTPAQNQCLRTGRWSGVNGCFTTARRS